MSSVHHRLVQLEAEIKHHDYLYFVADRPAISNSEYDILVAERNQILQDNPEFDSSHTPGFVEQEGKLLTTPILEPMISIDKKKKVEDFEKWIQKHIRDQAIYEEKLDGVALRLIYEFGNLTIAHLRGGDNAVGTVVTHRIKLVKNIPEWVEEFQEFSRVEVTGEVFCLYKDLDIYCQTCDLNPAETESRTTVSGMLKRLKETETDVLQMYFRAYHASKNLRDIYKDYLTLRTKFEEWGFDIPIRLDGSLLQELYKATTKPDFGYAIDGIVVKDNDLENWVEDKFVGYYKYCVCYKFPTKSIETKIADVDWGLTTQGVLVGTLVYDPVNYDGQILRRAKFDYADEYIKAGIRIGSTILVTKCNEIIPNMISLVEVGKGKPIQFPTKCPCCGEVLVRESQDVIRCVNDSCSGTFIKQMERVVSTKGLNIKGLGPKGIEALVNAGFLTSPCDLFKITYEDYMELDAFDQNQALSIIEQIKNLNLPLNKWLYAACIPNLGATAAEELAKQQGTLFTDIVTLLDVLKNGTLLCDLFDVTGLVMAKYATDNESELLRFFIHHDFTKPVEIVKDTIPVVFSGVWILPREQLKVQLLEHGFSLEERVTKTVVKLIIGKNPSPGKIAAAEKYGIPVIQVDQLTTIDELIRKLSN